MNRIGPHPRAKWIPAKGKHCGHWKVKCWCCFMTVKIYPEIMGDIEVGGVLGSRADWIKFLSPPKKRGKRGK